MVPGRVAQRVLVVPEDTYWPSTHTCFWDLVVMAEWYALGKAIWAAF